jgi:hypothetical protein
MPGKDFFITHTFNGGWATDFGPQYYGTPDGNKTLAIPFLTNAENIVFELDGGLHKVGGTSNLNSSAIESATTEIRGLFDYWRQGSAAAPTQRRTVFANNGKVYADNADGVFVEVHSGLTGSAVPCFSTYNDLMLFCTDSTADVPHSWDQTTFQDLAGSPPRMSFIIKHKNRAWGAGNFAVPSRLYYSQGGNPEAWTGGDSGSIDIDLGDGDMITGIASYKNDLWVFKGPNTGSIHRITGSSPTGADAFARTTFINGLGAAWQNAIFTFGDDLGFVSAWGTVHSLRATAAYANYNQAQLSFPISSYLQTSFTPSQARQIWAVNDVPRGRVIILFAADGNTTNNTVLAMDYRFGVDPPAQYPRWTKWPAFTWSSIANVIDSGSSNKPQLFAGSFTGRVQKTNQPTRTNISASIPFKMTTPYLDYGDEPHFKTLEAVSIGIRPFNTDNIIFNWVRDGGTSQLETLTGASLGSLLDVDFLLNSSFLGGTRHLQRFRPTETGGEFRSIQYEITQNTNNSDIELHSFGASITLGSVGYEDV